MEYSNESFRLGDWTVIPARMVIAHDGEERKLEPKAMEMLVFLAGHPNQVIRRETLISAIWKDTFGTDELLSRIISLLRSQLGDDSRNPRYIETIPKVGYRLLVAPASGSAPPSASTEDGDEGPRGKLVMGSIVAALVATVAIYFVMPREVPSPVRGPYTIAVLPFEDLSGSDVAPFFPVGLTDELIVNLSRSPDLRVVARRSLRNNDSAAKMDIDYFVEGSVTFFPDRIRVFTELTSGVDNTVVWSEAYESASSDYLDIQRAISTRITEALSDRLDTQIAVTARTDVDLDAYTAYLNGIFLTKLRGEEPLRASIEAFSRALEIEPAFESARLGLANAYVLLPYYSDLDEADMFAAAEAVLGKLDNPNGAEADAIRGFMAFRRWQWQDAERHFLGAIDKNPALPNTYVWYSQFLSAVGRNRQALAVAHQAYALDSVSPVVNDRLATAYLWNDETRQARERYEAGARFGFTNRVNPGYLLLLLRTGEFDRAREVLRRLHPETDIEPLLASLEDLTRAEPDPALVETVARLIREGRLMPRLELGVWMMLRQWQRVAETVAKYRERHRKKYIDVEFLFADEAAGLRATPVFEQLTRELGLRRYWDTSYPPDFIEES